ncbi:hypothetical protein LMH87_002016 [Akanthomyces muscarius]|uniref:NAD(P)-binding protein n=1 Tax=Akanthomyces muscarius TaxID=2231603 RepID=A0A9W8UJ89_AKAMU|nr:hypothetical protein LMH87_002016 [Akanthomyces muscarius]KAJ4147503.1 hypothetical protein LMH87_002016 [Akanthomyces muscarius]
MFFSSKSFDPEKDIPSLKGKVILITGGTAGIGKQAVLEFARHSPKQIWLAARNVEKTQATIDEIRSKIAEAPIIPLHLDLASFESIENAAKKFIAESDRLDILMLNGGVAGLVPGLTEDGYEIQFGTNHMGHALLTKLLVPKLEQTQRSNAKSDVRVVVVASAGHRRAPRGGILFDRLKKADDENIIGAYGRYCQSKLANILFTRHFATLYPQYTIAAIHPGTIKTDIFSNATAANLAQRALIYVAGFFLSSVEYGVKNQLWASVSPDVQSGEYYEPIGYGGTASQLGKDDALAEKLWNWTEKELSCRAKI